MSKNKQNVPLSKKIVTYSIAASGALAIGAQVDAAPQYSGVINKTISWTLGAPDTFAIDIDDDMSVEYSLVNDINGFVNMNQIIPISSNAKMQGQLSCASYLTTSDQIGTDNQFGKYVFLGVGEGIAVPPGNFLGKTGFIGVQFKKGNDTHYGWIHFEGPNPPTYGKIIDWGYESEPDTPILAGAPKYTQPTKTHTIPTLNEWGMLILMALILEEGLRRMRREKDTLVQLVEIS
jgi:hypothetical protein